MWRVSTLAVYGVDPVNKKTVGKTPTVKLSYTLFPSVGIIRIRLSVGETTISLSAAVKLQLPYSVDKILTFLSHFVNKIR